MQLIQGWKSEPGITIHDLFFANHAFILANVIYIQFWYNGKTTANVCTIRFCQFAIYGATLLLISTLSSTSILDVFYYLSAVKAVITLVKYIPQVILHMNNKSTIGWSLENVLLDFIGGICSLAQSIVDAVNAKNIYLVLGNPIKLALGLISLMFDVIFIFQYFYYRNNDTSIGIEESDPLLDESEVIDHENSLME